MSTIKYAILLSCFGLTQTGVFASDPKVLHNNTLNAPATANTKKPLPEVSARAQSPQAPPPSPRAPELARPIARQAARFSTTAGPKLARPDARQSKRSLVPAQQITPATSQASPELGKVADSSLPQTSFDGKVDK